MTFAEVEAARKLYATKRSKTTRICLSIYFVALFLIILTRNYFFIFHISALFLVITVIAIALTTHKEHADYIKSYKAYFVAASLAKIFTNISYNHNSSMPREIVQRVMTTADRYHSNDFMTATYKNINFAQADVHIEEEHTDSDGDKTYVTIFKGRFLVFDFDRNFTTNLQVLSRHFAGARLKHSANHLKFQRIQTESGDFNKNFRIFAEDGVDALYILDPAFMEKIQKLYTDAGHEILLTFIDKKVYIAINDGKDSLEPPHSAKKPLDEQAEIARVQKDIFTITNFVDSLNLDRYFKGEK